MSSVTIITYNAQMVSRTSARNRSPVNTDGPQQSYISDRCTLQLNAVEIIEVGRERVVIVCVVTLLYVVVRVNQSL